MDKSEVLLGIAEVLVGAFLASPADEAVVHGGIAVGTAGAGTPLSIGIAPTQMAFTGIIGIIVAMDGIRRIMKGIH